MEQNVTPAEQAPEISRVDPRLLEILVCPLTKTTLEYDAANQELISRAARLAYPIRDGIPIMLPEEARKIDDVPQVTMPLPTPIVPEMSGDKDRGAVRADIDSGRTGDKVAAPDPSAAPLGTDEEAGGMTTPEEALEKARRAELRLGQNARREEGKKG
jgi:uncharacterized protein YbaR (Trm112 family)